MPREVNCLASERWIMLWTCFSVGLVMAGRLGLRWIRRAELKPLLVPFGISTLEEHEANRPREARARSLAMCFMEFNGVMA